MQKLPKFTATVNGYTYRRWDKDNPWIFHSGAPVHPDTWQFLDRISELERQVDWPELPGDASCGEDDMNGWNGFFIGLGLFAGLHQLGFGIESAGRKIGEAIKNAAELMATRPQRKERV